MRNKANNQNKFLRFITIPIRVLGKAKDLYVRSITDYAERVNYGNVGGLAAAQMSTLPKSFSVSSSRSNNDSEDFRELIRAASTRSMGNRVDMDLYMQQQMRQSTAAMGPRGVPRSCSVGMGKIDEDKPCDFGEDNNNIHGHARAELLYPRSRSYAVTKRSVIF